MSAPEFRDQDVELSYLVIFRICMESPRHEVSQEASDIMEILGTAADVAFGTVLQRLSVSQLKVLASAIETYIHGCSENVASYLKNMLAKIDTFVNPKCA